MDIFITNLYCSLKSLLHTALLPTHVLRDNHREQLICLNREMIMTLSAHKVTKHLYMAHRYDDVRGNFFSSRRMTKDHVVCSRTPKNTTTFIFTYLNCIL